MTHVFLPRCRGLCRAVCRQPRRLGLVALLVIVLCGAGYCGTRQYRARALQQQALRALERWDFRQAHADLAYCVDVWPADGPTRFLAAHAARRAGFLDEADEHLRQAERAAYPRDRLVLEWALLQAQRGEVGAVEGPLLDRVAKDDLDAPLILEALALGYIHVYQVPKAGRCLDALLERQPRNAFALLWRGHCLEAIGVQEKALEDYRRALEIEPDYDEARFRLADRLATRLKHYPEAAEHFEVLHTRQPTNLGVTLGLARCRRLLGDGAQAELLLDEALRAQPDDLAVLAERGQLALDRGRPADAERDLRAAAAVPAPDRQVLHGLYQALQQQGRTAEAATVLARGQQMDADIKEFAALLKGIGAAPDNAALYCRAAAICRRNGQDAEALRWLQGALTRNPDYRPAHAALADHFERHDNAAAAAHHRQRAAE